MQTLVFTVRDCAANIFTPVFEANTTAQAQRNILMEMESPDSVIARYPSQFDLFCLGIYDNVTGQITLNPAPELVCNIQSLVTPTKEEQ